MSIPAVMSMPAPAFFPASTSVACLPQVHAAIGRPQPPGTGFSPLTSDSGPKPSSRVAARADANAAPRKRRLNKARMRRGRNGLLMMAWMFTV